MRISFCEFQGNAANRSVQELLCLSILFYEDFFLRGRRQHPTRSSESMSLSILFYEDFFLRAKTGSRLFAIKGLCKLLSILFYEDFFLRVGIGFMVGTMQLFFQSSFMRISFCELTFLCASVISCCCFQSSFMRISFCERIRL